MLNHRQRLFASAYAVSGIATQSAKAAGYSSKTAASQGERLLKNAEIKKAITKQQKALSDKTQVTVEWVIGELVKTYHAATRDSHHIAAKGCLELLGKTQAAFTDKLATTHPVIVNIIKPNRTGQQDAE